MKKTIKHITMKKITLILLLVGLTGMAQVKGNKNISSRTISTEGLTDLEMGLYAKVTIDAFAKADMTITTDSNLLDRIDVEIVDGTMKLSQTEWIQPSEPIIITLGAPVLKRLQLDVHETVIFKNVSAQSLSLMAIHGKIVVDGTVEEVGIGAENGIIDAQELNAQKVYLNIWGDGGAIVNAAELLESNLSEDARLKLIGKPRIVKGDINKAGAKKGPLANGKGVYIDIKIKNNSWNRNHFAVKGPKADGSMFGYGFPMMPGAVKKERWTVGTKIYKVNKIGLKKLLVELTADDAGKMVSLFK
jgi:hypothetical protein